MPESGSELRIARTKSVPRRGRVTALDESIGKVDYDAYSTGPDQDVHRGPDFKRFYASVKGNGLGASYPGAWKFGGAAMWAVSPTIRTSIWSTMEHPIRDLGTRISVPATTFRPQPYLRDPDGGAAHWVSQFNPHDLWDHDEIQRGVI